MQSFDEAMLRKKGKMTQNGEKTSRTDDAKVVGTSGQYNDFDNGLRILAKMIARAYRKELEEKRQAEAMNQNDSGKGVVTSKNPTNESDNSLNEIYESD